MPVKGLPRVCAVEMPGRVVNIDEAVASVGGLNMVRQSLKNPKGKLRLRLCREYKFQAPVPLERRKSCDVLVRAKKRSDGSWACEPIGIVDATFAPQAMADYLFVPGKDFEYGGSTVFGSLESELAGRRPSGDLYMPPAFFTRIDTPRQYGFQDNPFGKPTRNREVVKLAGTSEGKLQRKWLPVSMVRFQDVRPVPLAPPEGARAQVRAEEAGILERVRQLFEERPVWLRGPLEDQLKRYRFVPNVTTMQEVLRVVAYLWSDGPWRSAYVRLGFDPRSIENAEEAQKLQVIDFRDRFFRQQHAYFEAVQAARSGKSGEKAGATVDYHFRTAPANRSQLYQFTDIEDDIVQEILRDATPAERADEKSGWFAPSGLSAIRERMAVKAEIMRRCKQAEMLSLQGGAEKKAIEAAPKQAALRGVARQLCRPGARSDASRETWARTPTLAPGRRGKRLRAAVPRTTLSPESGRRMGKHLRAVEVGGNG